MEFYVREFSCRRTSFIFSPVMTLQTVVRLVICIHKVALGQSFLLTTSPSSRRYHSTKAPYLLVYQRLYRQLAMSLPLSFQWGFKLDSAFRFTRPNVELKSTCYLTKFCNSFFPNLLPSNGCFWTSKFRTILGKWPTWRTNSFLCVYFYF